MKNLIEKLKKENKQAFDYIFHKYFQPLCLFANKYINDINSTEDVVQEVFVSFWEKRNAFNNYTAIKTYLYTAVRNKCLNILKHQQVIEKHQQELVYQLESDMFFVNHVVEEEVYKQLISEINKLSKSCKDVTLLALQGLKNQDIADELNISVNTVKTHKKIAFSKIRLELKQLMTSILLAI